IGDVLLIQAQTVGRVEVTEKPEITWDQPALDRLYERLAAEYELHDRDLALSRKLELVSRTAETYLDLLNSRQNIRLEWYIVVLILVEIGLALYQFIIKR
ncbi:MAG TPA: RMD1 family protein, partial [Syntrophorhabdales bacterium]|nr:RMD1 family protein [Syntrophorhabdales bacterium]